MGCTGSRSIDAGGRRQMPASIGEIAVFLPGFRIPKNVDLSPLMAAGLPRDVVERLSALRTQISAMTVQEAAIVMKPRHRIPSRQGGSKANELLNALGDYLSVLLGLVKDGSQFRHVIQFLWTNQEDDAEETAIGDAWYEVLSALHLMAMVCLSQANSLLLPRSHGDGYQPRVSEESRRASVDVFIKAAGFLECANHSVLPQMPPEFRKELPVDLAERNLKALSLQSLGQGVEIQLGLAIDSPKATLAVKRRLACELVKYWQQAQENINLIPFPDGWGRKHQLFVKWKFAEAKAAAYYFHGLILDEGNTEKSHGMAVASLQASEEYLKESKKTCDAFHSAIPASRSPPAWGFIKYLSEKIPKDAASKVRINRDLYSQDRPIEAPPPLPDFVLALKAEDYQLPPLDPLWSIKESNQ